jgi:hypothetical protein
LNTCSAVFVPAFDCGAFAIRATGFGCPFKAIITPEITKAAVTANDAIRFISIGLDKNSRSLTGLSLFRP